MATRKNYLYLGGVPERVNPIPQNPSFEFDESDLWNSNDVVISPEPTKKPIPSSRAIKKPFKKTTNNDQARPATSLPVHIPDWSKILRGEYKNRSRDYNEDDNDAVEFNENDDHSDRIPPHEYLARTRVASFSVHEGFGRTLKGRDLSMVRNAIWKQTGFED